MNPDSLITLLADLVSIPSMNPMGRARTGEQYSEEPLAGYVADYLRKWRVDVEVDEVSPGRPNVIGYVDVGAAETLLLETHLDTVHVENMEVEPFDPVVKDGKLYGRGSCDAKGALSAFLHATCSLLAEGRIPHYNIVLAAVSDEEYRFTGAQQLIAHGLKASFGIAGEPTRLRIVRAHKGVIRWRIVTQGRSAHSAYPEQGENAIYIMAHLIQRLEEHSESLLARMPHPDLGKPTLSVGVIEGGQAVNIVPDRCWIEVDRRTLPGETREDVLAPIRVLLSEVQGWTLESPYLCVSGMEVSPNAQIIRLLSSAIKLESETVVIETAQYATDAGMYNAAGIPTVVFGPGDIAQAHTAYEFIEISQVVTSEAIIRRVLTP